MGVFSTLLDLCLRLDALAANCESQPLLPPRVVPTRSTHPTALVFDQADGKRTRANTTQRQAIPWRLAQVGSTTVLTLRRDDCRRGKEAMSSLCNDEGTAGEANLAEEKKQQQQCSRQLFHCCSFRRIENASFLGSFLPSLLWNGVLDS